MVMQLRLENCWNWQVVQGVNIQLSVKTVSLLSSSRHLIRAYICITLNANFYSSRDAPKAMYHSLRLTCNLMPRLQSNPWRMENDNDTVSTQYRVNYLQTVFTFTSRYHLKLYSYLKSVSSNINFMFSSDTCVIWTVGWLAYGILMCCVVSLFFFFIFMQHFRFQEKLLVRQELKFHVDSMKKT